MTKQSTRDILAHLATRPGHDEVKADFRQLLIEEFGAEFHALNFEQRVPEVKGRLDALVGRTVLEAKRNLTAEWGDVERRMPDYLADRERETGERFVGLATDGLRWVVFERQNEQLQKIKEATLDPAKAEQFLAWLDGAIAIRASLPPDPLTVKIELGQDSVAYRRARDKLSETWSRIKDAPATALKRQLWNQLLTLVYGRTIEGDALWFQHTFLVIVAKAIALAVLGLKDDDPARILSGAAFRDANINGAVESDFFDWPLADPEGRDLVRRIANHVGRFRLREAETDVLKVLYESLIDPGERHDLGEYYTPDWLAAKVVKHSIKRPVEDLVLDPACGSGSFLFHAVRLYLLEAEAAGMDPGDVAYEATLHVAGMDIHPVAAIIARVTYLLALAPVLNNRSGPISIPVYLGDALQLEVTQFFTGKKLTVTVPPLPPDFGPATLDFPEVFCKEPPLFDKAIQAIDEASERGLSRQQVEKTIHRITTEHYRRPTTDEEDLGIVDLGKTFLVYDELRKVGRDSIWSYVARNLSRPLAFSARGGRVTVLIGNPPWVALRHMSDPLQTRFKELAKDEGVYVGGKFATQNDLSALFTIRTAALYSRPSGRIAFVMPLAALTRGQFGKFRSGDFKNIKIAFDEAWTMDDGVFPLFPVPSCVVFAKKRGKAEAAPSTVRAYSGTLPYRDAHEDIADLKLTVQEGGPAPATAQFTSGSPYRRSFRQGATLVPRMLCLVERRTMGKLGADPSMPLVRSRRSTQEKKPWNGLEAIEHRVEAGFIRPVLLGESILPFRLFRPFEGVIPVNGDGTILNAKGAADRGHSGIVGWMSAAEKTWNEYGDNKMKLIEQFDYYGKLSVQFPIPSLRVVYAASGTLPAACVIRDNRAVVEHILYWFAPGSETEANYLIAILNSETGRKQISNLQAVGQFGARHFDKVMFTLPIPRFDPSEELHEKLASLAVQAEALAADVTLPDNVKFQRARRLVREALAEAGISQDIDEAVRELLSLPKESVQ
jgi:SAM-dependent methyltransferase